MENVCKPGSTLLWDLLQDDKIVSICIGNLARAEDVFVMDTNISDEKLIVNSF
jgi:hypothetical protein